MSSTAPYHTYIVIVLVGVQVAFDFCFCRNVILEGSQDGLAHTKHNSDIAAAHFSKQHSSKPL